MKIVETYHGEAPFPNAAKVVARMLASVPLKYLNGLESVELVTSTALSRHDRRQRTRSGGRKRGGPSSSLGAYCASKGGQSGHIQLYVDNIFRAQCGGFAFGPWRWPFFTAGALGPTLFHEVGHHIHRFKVPDRGDPEDVAKQWASKLMRRYMWRHYWYVAPFLYVCAPLMKWGADRAERWALRNVRGRDGKADLRGPVGTKRH